MTLDQRWTRQQRPGLLFHLHSWTGRFINLLFLVPTHTAHGILVFPRLVQPNIISTSASIQPHWHYRHDLYNLSKTFLNNAAIAAFVSIIWWEHSFFEHRCIVGLPCPFLDPLIWFCHLTTMQEHKRVFASSHHNACKNTSTFTLAWNQSNCTRVLLSILGCCVITTGNLYLF